MTIHPSIEHRYGKLIDAPPWIARSFAAMLRDNIRKVGDQVKLALNIHGVSQPPVEVWFEGVNLDGRIMIRPKEDQRFAVFRSENYFGGPL